MKYISDRLASIIVRRSGRDDVYQEVIGYGLQAVLGTVAEFVSVIALGVVLGLLKEMLVISTVFAIIRVTAGGVHFSTYARCYVSTLCAFVSGGVISRFFSTAAAEIAVSYIVIGFSISIYLLYRYSPRDNPNRLIKEDELPRFRRLSFGLAGIIFIIISMGYYVNGEFLWYHYSMVTGLLMESSMLTDTSYRVVEYIESTLLRKGGAEDEKS
jgi:accessory gene regulator B